MVKKSLLPCICSAGFASSHPSTVCTACTMPTAASDQLQIAASFLQQKSLPVMHVCPRNSSTYYDRSNLKPYEKESVVTSMVTSMVSRLSSPFCRQ
jgi:hypothetical protein